MLPSQLESHTLKTLPWQFSISLRGRKLVGGPLKHHEWTIYDLQYVFLFTLGLFLFYIIDSPGFALKLVIVALFAIGLCHPVSRIFVLPFLPVACWLILFYACRFIPGERRPHIYVSLLPTLENILYGDNLSAIIATHTNVIKDVLAWFPYGVVHFTIPFITSAGLWWFGPPGILRVFASAFGYMNIAGVLTQLAFPCSPPWYEYTYGLNTPANYEMHGHPGGLARIDELFNTNTYTTTFGGSPMVFGAFPSLHSGCAIIQALFISYLAPKLRAFCFAYVMWIWWACMYLTHHYMVDLVGGGVYAGVAFWCAWKWLPPVHKGLSTRWDYLKEGLLPTHDDYIRDSTALYIRVPTSHSRQDSSLDGGLDDSVIIVAEDTNGTTIFDIDDEMDLGDGFSKISKFDR